MLAACSLRCRRRRCSAAARCCSLRSLLLAAVAAAPCDRCCSLRSLLLPAIAAADYPNCSSPALVWTGGLNVLSFRAVVMLTAFLSVPFFAVPAAMLTWGFEGEAQRLHSPRVPLFPSKAFCPPFPI